MRAAQAAQDTLMATDVAELTGVTARLAAKLRLLGIHDTAQFLAIAGHPVRRAALVATLGIDRDALLVLAHRADLLRIAGLTSVHTDLLALAGVDTVAELRRRMPENLYARLLMVVAQHQLACLPGLDAVQRWVQEARQLERAIYYE